MTYKIPGTEKMLDIRNLSTGLKTFAVLKRLLNSVDAISHTQDKIIFIEFKNGKMKSEIRKVKEKLRDSILIFGDIVEKTISYTRENAEFVLVYNEEKNPLPNQLTKGIVQEAPSRTAISKKLAQKGKQEFIYQKSRIRQNI